MHIEILEKIDIELILQEANDIKVMLRKGWKDIDQIGLQGHKPDLDWKDEWSRSTGTAKKDFPETYFKYPLWDTPAINRLIDKYGMVRTRIIASSPKTNLSFHNDLTKRIHIPLFSNPDCIMIIEDKIYYLEPGYVYLTNTTLKHTAMNASQQQEVHIVGCMYS